MSTQPQPIAAILQPGLRLLIAWPHRHPWVRPPRGATLPRTCPREAQMACPGSPETAPFGAGSGHPCNGNIGGARYPPLGWVSRACIWG